MDSLYIQDLELWTRIGVPDDERASEQRLLVSVELFTDLAPAAKADDVTKSIDYARVAADVQTLAGTARKTLERFVEDVAAMILKTYSPAGGVKVSAQKFVLPNAKAVHATIVRKP
ncbi:MAG TPA: dihydroneopterin aldolase [Candidatus Peribacteria bacterium]|nr:dihydroneopterin aldolase [Candidatus Peribacteria bacterium]